MNSRLLSLVPMVMLFILTTASLYFMAGAAQNQDRFEERYLYLIYFNGVLLALLLIIVTWRVFVLVRDLLRRKTGSRLTWRMVISFITVALIPVLMVFWFSTRFLGGGIDNWFEMDLGQSLEDAMELTRLSIDFQMREQQLQVEDVALAINELGDAASDVLLSFNLENYRRAIGAEELTLLGRNNRIIATSSEYGDLDIATFPSEDVVLNLAQENNYRGLEPQGDGSMKTRVLVRLPAYGRLSEPRVLVGMFPVSNRITMLGNQVQESHAQLNTLVYSRAQLMQIFILTLSLVLLMSTLFAVWAAFAVSRQMLSPVAELADATRAVAAGDYQQRIPVLQHDELGFLVQSFNEMTSRVEQAQNSAELSQRVIEDQRSYLQAVLSHLSSGVLTIDAAQNLRTANDAANRILESKSPLQKMVGRPFVSLRSNSLVLESFIDQIKERLQERDWQVEIPLFGESGRKVLLCRAIEIPELEDQGSGTIIVFDDITNMLTAQRDAAWGEVARRLAHEIKNPLTPIQLSAERMTHKLGGELQPTQAKILEQSTAVIVQQVEAMKQMVNEFREYASPQQPVLELQDFNLLVKSVADLYQDYDSGSIQFSPGKNVPMIFVDPGRIRQVLHNLIKNAFEALSETSDGSVRVTTRYVENDQGRYVELAVLDNGTGIDDEMQEKLFDPYVTSKHKGTGLGLAIVKKIAEEHSGIVVAKNRATRGAEILVRLPYRKAFNREDGVKNT